MQHFFEVFCFKVVSFKFVHEYEVVLNANQSNRDYMSLINSTVNRVERDETVFANQQEEPEQFLSICQRYQEKMMRQAESHKKMDMIYNYMVKNDIKTQRKTDIKEEKVRKTRKDKEGRKYICGACKLGYLSYPALYTHIKTKHNGETPEGTIRGESGKPKKRGRPKVRKTPQIYERELEKNDFPKELTGLLSRESLEILELFDGIEPGEEEEAEIMLKYFVGIVREMKKVQQTKIYLLPISQVITTFLDNLKEFVSQDTLKGFQETFFDLIEYTNRNYSRVLAQLQSVSQYYINCTVSETQKYCEVERPYFLPVFVQKYIKSELAVDDELELTLLLDFCKWLVTYQLTDIKISRENSTAMIQQ